MSNSLFLSEHRSPVPDSLLRASIVLCGFVPYLLYFRTVTPVQMSVVLCAVAAVALTYMGWSVSRINRNGTSIRVGVVLLLLSPLVAIAGLYVSDKLSLLTTFSLLVLPALVLLHSSLSSNAHIAKHILVPFLFGSIFLFVAGSLGVPVLGVFPAAIGTLFVAVVRATLDIEEDIFANHGDSDQIEVEHHYRHKLAITAVIFFLFGTVSLWPWLGEIYSKAYFWILLLGVLIPLAYFWGRIRQPKIEGARTALIRFNRIAPVIGLVHVLAFLVS